MPMLCSIALMFSSRCRRLMNIIFSGSFMHQCLSTDERINGQGKGKLSWIGSKCSGITDGVSILFPPFSSVYGTIALLSWSSPSPLSTSLLFGRAHKGDGESFQSRCLIPVSLTNIGQFILVPGRLIKREVVFVRLVVRVGLRKRWMRLGI